MTTGPKLHDIFMDNTKISAYKNCPRSYFLRHVMQWRSEGTAVPLSFGLSWHSGMDIVWTHAKTLDHDSLREAAFAAFMETWTSEGFPEDLDIDQIRALEPRTPGAAHEMYDHYIAERWNMLQDAVLIQAEQPFAVPLPSLDKSWYVGRLDKVIEYNGNKLVLEHKTTALYSKASGFQPSYIEGWYSDSQVKGYQFGAGLYYPGLTQVWVDAALVHKTIHNQFRFVPVSHNFDLIKEWLGDAQGWVSEIVRNELEYKQAGHLTPGCFKKNENYCYGKFGSCSFLDICRSTADIPQDMPCPPGYMVEQWSPFETLGLEKILNKE